MVPAFFDTIQGRVTDAGAVLTEILTIVKDAHDQYTSTIRALRLQLRDIEGRCAVLVANSVAHASEIRRLEEDNASFRRVSRVIALENDNALLQKTIATLKAQVAEASSSHQIGRSKAHVTVPVADGPECPTTRMSTQATNATSRSTEAIIEVCVDSISCDPTTVTDDPPTTMTSISDAPKKKKKKKPVVVIVMAPVIEDEDDNGDARAPGM